MKFRPSANIKLAGLIGTAAVIGGAWNLRSDAVSWEMSTAPIVLGALILVAGCALAVLEWKASRD